MPTESIENYLKAIFLLEEVMEPDVRISTKQIAGALGFSQASVSGMLQSLAEDDYVCYEKYKGVRLSERGRKAALNVIRKHRLIEMLLVEHFQYSWEEVHEEAESLEHAVSDRLAQRIDKFLGFPDFDPHGDPIPNVRGEFPDREIVSLAEAKEGMTVYIARVNSLDISLLKYLKTINISIGTKIHVKDVLSLDGQMLLRINDTFDIALSKQIISNLFIQKPCEVNADSDRGRSG